MSDGLLMRAIRALQKEKGTKKSRMDDVEKEAGWKTTEPVGDHQVDPGNHTPTPPPKRNSN